MTTSEPWAVKLRDRRHIGDFRRWKDHDAYQQAFELVLRDLNRCRGERAVAAPHNVRLQGYRGWGGLAGH